MLNKEIKCEKTQNQALSLRLSRVVIGSTRLTRMVLNIHPILGLGQGKGHSMPVWLSNVERVKVVESIGGKYQWNNSV